MSNPIMYKKKNATTNAPIQVADEIIALSKASNDCYLFIILF